MRRWLIVAVLLVVACDEPPGPVTTKGVNARRACWDRGGVYAWVPDVEAWICFRRDTIPL